MTLRVSNPALEGTYQGSKHLKFQVLCEESELSELFERFGIFWLYPLSGLVDGNPIDPDDFLHEYGLCIEELKQGRVPSDASLRRLASALTAETEALWKQEVPGNRYLIKVAKPVVHLQAHYFTYSPLDDVFRPMSMGSNSIFWGLQFSFPQVYQDPKTMEFFEVDESANSELFQKIKQWVRDLTRPTPFVVEGKRTNSPIRLGKKCFSWIHQHPQLIEQKIGIYAV